MFRALVSIVIWLLLHDVAFAQEPAPEISEDQVAEEAPAAEEADAEPESTAAAADEAGEARSTLGISILGNEETPTSLVIVPWKSSQIGGGIDVNNVLDDRATPVDRDVFMRELRYYQIRSNGAE